MTKKNSAKRIVQPGDVYAIPLGGKCLTYGYLKTYNGGVNVAVYGVISKRKILELNDILKHDIVMNAGIGREGIEKGRWPYVGNSPFPNEEQSWLPPHKQPPPSWNPSVRMVVYRGDWIPSNTFFKTDSLKEFDALPVYEKYDDDHFIAIINERVALFTIIDMPIGDESR